MTELARTAGHTDAVLQIQRRHDPDGVTLVLRGELDLSSAGELERLVAEVHRGEPGRLLLDLSNLEFIDSTGIALMIRAERAAQENGHELHLRSGSPQVQRVLQLTGILDRFTFED